MSNPIRLQHDTIYHIYNRGNNGEDLFFEERNYRTFLQLYIRHVHPVVEMVAYCLLRNHFHLLVKVKSEHEVPKPPSQYFSNLFNAYAKAINRAYDRTGALFERPFQRVAVTDETYFARLVTYIHFNPVRHGFVDHPGEWLFSSYDALRSREPTRLRRDVVLDWFGDREEFVSGHEDVDLSGLEDLTGLDMSVEEAIDFLVEECRLEPLDARAEVRRYTLTPTQPQCYLMGKLSILELVDEVRRARPGASLREIHDAILGCGSLPPRLMRQQLLG